MSDIKKDQIYKIAAHHRFQWEEAQDCHVILFPEGMVKLNPSGGEILKLVDGKTSIQSVINTLKEKFQGVDSLEDDVLAMFSFALDKAWIEKI